MATVGVHVEPHAVLSLNDEQGSKVPWGLSGQQDLRSRLTRSSAACVGVCHANRQHVVLDFSTRLS